MDRAAKLAAKAASKAPTIHELMAKSERDRKQKVNIDTLVAATYGFANWSPGGRPVITTALPPPGAVRINGEQPDMDAHMADVRDAYAYARTGSGHAPSRERVVRTS